MENNKLIVENDRGSKCHFPTHPEFNVEQLKKRVELMKTKEWELSMDFNGIFEEMPFQQDKHEFF